MNYKIAILGLIIGVIIVLSSIQFYISEPSSKVKILDVNYHEKIINFTWQYSYSTNYQIKILVTNNTGIDSGNVVYTNGSCQNFPYDIYFISDWSGNLSHWIENRSSSWATIWILIPDIWQGDNNYIYMRYGDGTSDSSDGNAVFPFFDDFNDNAFNYTKWNYSHAIGKIENSDITSIENASSAPTALISNWYCSSGYSMITNFKQLRGNDHQLGWVGTGTIRGTYPSTIITYYYASDYPSHYRQRINASLTNCNPEIHVDTNFHTYEIQKVSNNLTKFRYDNGTLINDTHIYFAYSNTNVAFYSSFGTQHFHINYVYVRKIVDIDVVVNTSYYYHEPIIPPIDNPDENFFIIIGLQIIQLVISVVIFFIILITIFMVLSHTSGNKGDIDVSELQRLWGKIKE